MTWTAPGGPADHDARQPAGHRGGGDRKEYNELGPRDLTDRHIRTVARGDSAPPEEGDAARCRVSGSPTQGDPRSPPDGGS
jgi:hypothetical protein